MLLLLLLAAVLTLHGVLFDVLLVLGHQVPGPTAHQVVRTVADPTVEDPVQRMALSTYM